MDLEEARFTISEVAKITGADVGTIRSWFQRGHLRLAKGKDKSAKSEGLPRLFSGHTVIAIALIHAVVVMGIHPKVAAAAAYDYAVFGTAERLPGDLFKKGFTVLAFYPNGLFDVKNVLKSADFVEVLTPPGHTRSDLVTIFVVNFIVERIVKALEAA